MESSASGFTSWNCVFSLCRFLEKLYPPVCKPKAIGRGIAMRSKAEQKGIWANSSQARNLLCMFFLESQPLKELNEENHHHKDTEPFMYSPTTGGGHQHT